MERRALHIISCCSSAGAKLPVVIATGSANVGGARRIGRLRARQHLGVNKAIHAHSFELCSKMLHDEGILNPTGFRPECPSNAQLVGPE